MELSPKDDLLWLVFAIRRLRKHRNDLPAVNLHAHTDQRSVPSNG